MDASRPTAADTYTFGDTPTAARRLALLAEVFDPPTRALLTAWSPSPVDHALDLGCGPGHTTALVHATSGARRTTGLERSAEHVARARAAAPAGVEVVQHDVTVGPLPVAPAQLALSRFLLTHLAAPGAALATWVGALVPGGRLLAQETARLASADPVLGRYYALVDELQRHHGQALDIGSRLGDLAAAVPGTEVVHAAVVPLRPSVPAMAALHAMNVRTWRTDPYAVTAFDPAELDDLTTALDVIAAGGRATADVELDLAEVVVERGRD
ncbi:class I SAM-dependent methyltransferase [Actinotalea ferrariae]|uniref:class I SAM-dependent methyltransferase n=1 Tax=Actinotalea ferrariae TaxID=1386098 RepID=UPI001C8C67E2|nr:class I SAM-dependent methyltransferase [Actinotalea ferrariae]MBX9246383.1 class I SAM-dependent methyltransferase [Actinotalea ferrariae]